MTYNITVQLYRIIERIQQILLEQEIFPLTNGTSSRTRLKVERHLHQRVGVGGKWRESGLTHRSGSLILCVTSTDIGFETILVGLIGNGICRVLG